MKLSNDTKTKITGVLLLALATFIGSIPGAMIGAKAVQPKTISNVVNASDSFYHVEKVCRDTMYIVNIISSWRTYRLCHDVVIMKPNSKSNFDYVTEYIDSMQTKIDKFQKNASAYAALRKRAEANLNNHGSVGMRALADEMEIQREMQHILEQDSVQVGLK